MHHVDICNYFLCELKDQGLLINRKIPVEGVDADIFIIIIVSVKEPMKTHWYRPQDQASSEEALQE